MGDGESPNRSLRDGFGLVERWTHRSSQNRLKQWVLFDGNRERVATALLAAVFVLLLAPGGRWPIECQELLSETTVVQKCSEGTN